ncbi:MAG: hypothetical protein E7345_04630 [Clostridiales bacterium]|nr:hypothetical protein [Clostridiales bacterium]
MNERLFELFQLYRYLRVVQPIVEEIITLDYYVTNFNENTAIDLLDYCITKYSNEISYIGKLHENKVVVEDNPHIYETKSTREINSDVAYVRDCLIMIGAVQSGIRPSLKAVVEEIRG